MAADDAERTEPATAKRRQDAKKKGDVSQSKEVSAAILLGAMFLILSSGLGVRMLQDAVEQLRAVLGGETIRPATLGDYHAVLLYFSGRTARAFAPIALVMVVLSILAHVVQSGPMFSWEALSFQLRRINPANGFKRMLSLDQFVEILKAVLKITIVIMVSWWALAPAVAVVVSLSDAGLDVTLSVAGTLLKKLGWYILGAIVVLAVLDLFWVRHRYEKRLRMTKQEVRDEHKQREGDPKVRGKLRAQQRELTRHRMLAAVPNADVVITNPTHYAVALRYEAREMRAPKVLAKGRNHLALRIREEARKHEIPIVENPPLARALYRDTRVGREVPAKLFQAIAEVLAHVYRLDPRRRSAEWSAA